VNGNVRIVVTKDSFKYDNEVSVYFSKQTMEYSVGKTKDLTEVYCSSDGATSQCNNKANFSNFHHKDDLVRWSWCTASHCHTTGTWGGRTITRKARKVNLHNLYRNRKMYRLALVNIACHLSTLYN
jgi:hypothetical protein